LIRYVLKTLFERRKLRFEMERIQKEGKVHDNADVTFRIVLTY